MKGIKRTWQELELRKANTSQQGVFSLLSQEDIHARKKIMEAKLPKKVAKAKIIEEFEAMTVNHLETWTRTG